MVMFALVGLLGVVLVVSLVMLPLPHWLPAEDVLRYGRLSIAVMGLLWLALVPPLLIASRLFHRVCHRPVRDIVPREKMLTP